MKKVYWHDGKRYCVDPNAVYLRKCKTWAAKKRRANQMRDAQRKHDRYYAELRKKLRALGIST